jgi:hypothetical protein
MRGGGREFPSKSLPQSIIAPGANGSGYLPCFGVFKDLEPLRDDSQKDRVWYVAARAARCVEAIRWSARSKQYRPGPLWSCKYYPPRNQIRLFDIRRSASKRVVPSRRGWGHGQIKSRARRYLCWTTRNTKTDEQGAMIETHWALQQSENAYWVSVISLFDRMGNKADSGVETGALRWEKLCEPATCRTCVQS